MVVHQGDSYLTMEIYGHMSLFRRSVLVTNRVPTLYCTFSFTLFQIAHYAVRPFQNIFSNFYLKYASEQIIRYLITYITQDFIKVINLICTASGWISYFSIVVIKSNDHSILRKRGFILIYGFWNMQPTMSWKARYVKRSRKLLAHFTFHIWEVTEGKKYKKEE